MSSETVSPRPSPGVIRNQTSANRAYHVVFAYSLAWIVLVISSTASVGGWWIARHHEELAARKVFDEESSRIQSALLQRMLIYQDVLHGCAGLFAASFSVERDEWRSYVEMVSVGKRFPGIDGLGFIANVPRADIEAFLKTTRADKSPDFDTKDSGTSGDSFVVKYLEPEAQHASLLGMDFAADPERRAVAEKARDSGMAVVSSPINLHNANGEPQSGLLVMLPVYRNGTSNVTLQARRTNIFGWVFARFVTSELMRGILDKKAALLRCEVLDDTGAGKETLIFDSSENAAPQQSNHQSLFTSVSSLEVGQRLWKLRFSTNPEFEASISRSLEILAAIGGGLVSLLLFGIALSLSSTRMKALAMANKMTVAFREANQQLQQEIKDREYTEQRSAIQHSITRVLADSESVTEAAPKIVQTVCETLGWDYGALWRTKPMSNCLHCVETWHRPGLDVAEFEKETRQHSFAHGRGLPGRIWATSKPAWIKDVTRDNNFPRAPFAQKAKLHAAFGFPVMLGKQFLGVFEFFSHAIVEPDPELLKMVATIGSQIGQFIERKQARQELEHEQFLLRTLMDKLPDRIYFKDLQSRFLRNSRAHLLSFGLKDAREAIGKTDFDFFSEEHARQAFEDEQRLMKSGQPITIEEKETWPDGSVTWALTTKLPLRDEQGHIVGSFGISRDITDRKLAEEAMRIAKEAAEEANRTKSQFLANMSHELRTPLNSVIGFATILLKNKDGNLNPTELNFLERVQANGKHLLSLINEILDLSKIEARKVDLQLAPVSLDVLVRETIAQQEGLVRDRPVQLVADVPAKIVPMSADSDKLKQVIINLIGNALKFTERGSVTVRVATNPTDATPIRIDVIDTGIGIPKEKLGEIFEAFQQADATTARKYGGTGLGLTISQALCHLMGYHIDVASEPGRGSTFSIVLSHKEATNRKSHLVAPSKRATFPVPAALPPPSSLQGKLALVIDDESDSRVLLTHMLEEFGCRVIAADSGEQGLRKTREFKPQLITVDLLMPQMDGATVIRAIKADTELRHIPLVVVSIVAEERRGSILGAVDILEKPITRQDLLATLEHDHLPEDGNILIVDDEPDAREIIRSMLADKSYRFQTAANGREALACLDKNPPDLVILDLIMPVMDGITFLDAIRAMPRFQQLPVLVVTSKNLSRLEREQLRLQKLEFVKKAELSEDKFKQLLLRVLQQAEASAKPQVDPKPKL